MQRGVFWYHSQRPIDMRRFLNHLMFSTSSFLSNFLKAVSSLSWKELSMVGLSGVCWALFIARGQWLDLTQQGAATALVLPLSEGEEGLSLSTNFHLPRREKEVWLRVIAPGKDFSIRVNGELVGTSYPAPRASWLSLREGNHPEAEEGFTFPISSYVKRGENIVSLRLHSRLWRALEHPDTGMLGVDGMRLRWLREPEPLFDEKGWQVSQEEGSPFSEVLPFASPLTAPIKIGFIRFLFISHGDFMKVLALSLLAVYSLWVLMGLGLSLREKVGLREALRADASSFLPSLLLLMDFPSPPFSEAKIHSLLFIMALCAMMALKIGLLWKSWGKGSALLSWRLKAKEWPIVKGLIRAEKSDKAMMSFILMAAFFVRLSYGLGLDVIYVSSDCRSFDSYARNILAGKGFIGSWKQFPEARSFQPPLYPFFLSALYWLLPSHPYQFVRGVQALLGSLSCGVLFLMGRDLFGPSRGLLAAFMGCFNVLFILYTGLLVAETLFLFLFIIALALTLSGKRPLSLGFVLGLCTLCKSEVLFLLPVWLMGLFVRDRSLKSLFLLFLAFALTTMPWALRNYHLHGHWLITSTKGGYNLLRDNNPTGEDWPFQRVVSDKWASMEEIERDNFFLQKALGLVKEFPHQFMLNIGNRVARYWEKVSPTLGGLKMGWRSWLLTLSMIWPFALLGLVLSLRNWQKGFLLYLTLLFLPWVYYVSVSHPRFRLPLELILLLFASEGILWTIERCREGWQFITSPSEGL